MPGHRIQSVLLLGNNPAALNPNAVVLLCHRVRRHIQLQLLPGKYLGQLLRVRLRVGLRAAAGLLHITGTGPAPVFIISISPEGQPHGFNIVENLLRRHSLPDLYAEARVISQAAGAVHIKGPVRPGYKAQIPIGRMGPVRRGIGKSHLQLSRHLLRLDKLQQIVPRCLRPGKHVKIFSLLQAGKRRTHHIPREIPAASHNNNARVQRFFHDGVQVFRRQIVELHRLAGGKMHPGHAVLPNGSGHKGKALPRHPPGGHAQAQHAGLSVLLGVTSVVAGKSLVSAFVQLPGIKSIRLLPKCGKLLFPNFGINCSHI